MMSIIFISIRQSSKFMYFIPDIEIMWVFGELLSDRIDSRDFMEHLNVGKLDILP